MDHTNTAHPSLLRSCTLYCAEGRPAIVAANNKNARGIYWEQENPVVLEAWRDPESLGTAILTALERSSFRDGNFCNSKGSDWPSYRASRCRSISDFERLYLRISISALNEAHLFYRAESRPLREKEIGVCVTLNPFVRDAAEEMGGLVLKLFGTCIHLAPYLDESR